MMKRESNAAGITFKQRVMLSRLKGGANLRVFGDRAEFRTKKGMVNRMSYKYTTIINDIKDKIKKGVYVPGSNIPIEIEMCNQYGVSRITVQKAMKVLMEEGYIHRVSGKGTFVNDNVVADENASFTFVIFPNKELGFFDLIHGIENELIKAKSLCSLHFLGEQNQPTATCDRFELMLMNLLSFKPKGFIIYPPNSISGVRAYREIQKRGMFLILLDKECKDVPTDCVVTDNYSGMTKLTQYVIDRGHKNIGYISFKMEFGDSVVKRCNAFYNCMRENNIEIQESMIKTDNADMFDVERSVTELVNENPDLTAVICANDVIANTCYQIFEKLKISIPDDISVCSFDGYENFRHLTPKLTAMSQDLRGMGRMAARLMLIRQKETELSDQLQIKFNLPTTFLDCDSVKDLNKQ
jgi:DNA-binding LacI/PurR family transcriptional regulator